MNQPVVLAGGALPIGERACVQACRASDLPGVDEFPDAAGPVRRPGASGGVAAPAGGLGQLRGDPAEHFTAGPELGGTGPPGVGEPALHPSEPAGVEQPLEQLLALVGPGAQEPGELALRQQHHLEELVGVHPEQVGDDHRDLGDAVGAAGRPAGRRIADPAQRRGRLRDGGAAPPRLGPLVPRRAGDPQPLLGDRELQGHPGLGVRGGTVAAQPAGFLPGPRHGAEQRERDRIQQRRLAGAGVAVQQEQPVGGERVEVDP